MPGAPRRPARLPAPVAVVQQQPAEFIPARLRAAQAWGLAEERPQRRQPLAPSVIAASLRSFSTTFSVNENPLVDDGGWLLGGSTGVDWTNAAVISGVCQGTQDNSGAFDDSFTIRSGWNTANHKVRERLRKSSPTGLYEVECMLRGNMSANSFTGYECFFANDGSYCQIVRHKGPFGQFEYIADFGGVTAASDLDWFESYIVGNVITMTLFQSDGVTQRWQQTCDITVGVGHTPTGTISTGAPGMGFYKMSASGVYGLDRWQGNDL